MDERAPGAARHGGVATRQHDDVGRRRTGGEESRVTVTDPRREPAAQAVASALLPYQWRSFRPEMLARTVLAAHDRHQVHALLTRVPGAAVGRWDALQPVGRDDARLTVLVEFLSGHRWTELSLTTLCRQLLALLDDGPG
jgi:hypothetical protein